MTYPRPQPGHTRLLVAATLVAGALGILYSAPVVAPGLGMSAAAAQGGQQGTSAPAGTIHYVADQGERPEAVWAPPEPYSDKIVPILSIGEGKRIGAARVSGPSSKVDLVQAVAQLETKFKKVLEINVYVPISTKEPGSKLARVEGCAVTALGDLEF